MDRPALTPSQRQPHWIRSRVTPEHQANRRKAAPPTPKMTGDTKTNPHQLSIRPGLA